MSRQVRQFETEPFLQFDMNRHNRPHLKDDGVKKVYLGETEQETLLRKNREKQEDKNCFTNCCNNLTLRDIILCNCLWQTCNLDTDNCDCAPEKCCSGCGDACGACNL